MLGAAWPADAQTSDVEESSPPQGRQVEVAVELEGLGGELEDNVRAAVALLVQEGEELAPSRARTLFRRAPEEMRVALEPFGRYAPTIDGELNDDGDEWTATFNVDPGPVTVLSLGITPALVPAQAPVTVLVPARNPDPVMMMKLASCPLRMSDSGHFVPVTATGLFCSRMMSCRFDLNCELLVRRASSL